MSKDLLLKLYNLQKSINSNMGEPTTQDESLLYRYKYFIEHSDLGEDCHYAAKCKDLFLKFEYDRIKGDLLEVLEIMRTIEGKDFGNE